MTLSSPFVAEAAGKVKEKSPFVGKTLQKGEKMSPFEAEAARKVAKMGALLSPFRTGGTPRSAKEAPRKGDPVMHMLTGALAYGKKMGTLVFGSVKRRPMADA